MKSIIETIQKRHSVRDYSNKVIEKEKIQKISEYINSNTKGLLGNTVRFQIVDGSDYNKDQLKELGTYGMIKGARMFIAGAVKKNDYAMEDFGYCMEKIILMLTDFGLGTCWLGGMLNRSTFGKKMNISENEIIPAVSPIGYALSKNTFRERLISMVVGSKKRKKAEELFFDRSIFRPLDLNECGKFAIALECVRWAPSAGNLQPWRIIKDNDNFHFYMEENPRYNNLSRYEGAKLQNIDIGIAMAHFDLAAHELGIKGKWIISEPTIKKNELNYIVTWVRNKI